jgi:hypothetical protein
MDVEVKPELGKVTDVNEVVVWSWVLGIPTVTRAGDVEQWGATIGPSAEGLGGGILDTERVLVTTMVVYIVDKGDVDSLAQGQQVIDSVGTVVVLDNKHTLGIVGEQTEVLCETLECGRLVTVSTATVNDESVSTYKHSNLGVEVKLLDSGCDNLWLGRREDAELVWVEQETDTVGLG